VTWWCAWLGWNEELGGSGLGSGLSVGMTFLADGNRIRATEEALSGTALVMLAGDDAVEVVFVDQSPVTDE